MKCPICHTSETGTETDGDGNYQSFQAREMMAGTRETFSYVRCGGCGCVWLPAVPADMARYYPPDYYSLRPHTQRWSEAVVRSVRDRAVLTGRGVVGKLLRRLLPGDRNVQQALCSLRPLVAAHALVPESRIVDVGCGSGLLLLCLHNIGFRHLYGVEPHLADTDTTTAPGPPITSTIPIAASTLCEVAQERAAGQGAQQPADLIMFHHSFEHMAQPEAVLRCAAQMLRAGGYCLIRQPVVSSLAWRCYGPDWVQLDAPRHTVLHSLTSMRVLAARTGFALERVAFDSTAFQFWGSEQYTRDIPLLSPHSHRVNPRLSPFTPAHIRAWEEIAQELNQHQQGDSAVFYLRKR